MCSTTRSGSLTARELVEQGAADRAPDPPGGEGREAQLVGTVVALGRGHQAEVALLDQVHEVEALAAVAAGDGDDEPEVRLR